MGVTTGGVNSLVGTAISASLLPPIVNSGMMAAYCWTRPDLEDYSMYARSSLITFLLYILNVILIFCACHMVFWIKHVTAPETAAQTVWERKLLYVQEKQRIAEHFKALDKQSSSSDVEAQPHFKAAKAKVAPAYNTIDTAKPALREHQKTMTVSAPSKPELANSHSSSGGKKKKIPHYLQTTAGQRNREASVFGTGAPHKKTEEKLQEEKQLRMVEDKIRKERQAEIERDFKGPSAHIREALEEHHISSRMISKQQSLNIEYLDEENGQYFQAHQPAARSLERMESTGHIGDAEDEADRLDFMGDRVPDGTFMQPPASEKDKPAEAPKQAFAPPNGAT